MSLDAERLNAEIRKTALRNALLFGGKANPKAVCGKILGSFQEARKNPKEAMDLAEKIAAEINAMAPDTQKKEAEKLGISLEDLKDGEKGKEKAKEEKKALPDLPNAAEGNVVMRLAPNPNGPLHIGHSRMVILNDEYVKRYKGTLILRFDDSDPKNPNKLPMREAYGWIEEDLKWLGVKYSRIERVSARLSVYYDYFEKLLKLNGAYICTCKQKEWSALSRGKRKPCPCRSLSVGENIERWKKMLSGEYKQGGAVARVKTPPSENHLANRPRPFSPDLLSMVKNPAVIDWVAFRIIDNPKHPLAPKTARVWPMLDFASAIDDFDFKITHIIRGKDLAVSELRQKELYAYFKWAYPVTRIYGKFVTKEELVVSKSKINEGIRSGKYKGFDDPQLATLRAFRKRGILPETVRQYILGLGLSESETSVDVNILESINRKLVDPVANRYFFIEDPVVLGVSNPPSEISGKLSPKFTIRKHPKDAGRGERTLEFKSRIYISKPDADLSGEFNLMGAMKPAKISKEKGTLELLASTDSKRFIHWLPCDEKQIINAEIFMPDGSVKKGIAEANILSEAEGAEVQFERFGFARLDVLDKANKLLKAYYSHK